MLRYSFYSLLAFFIPVFLLFVFSGSLFPNEGVTSDAWVKKHFDDSRKIKSHKNNIPSNIKNASSLLSVTKTQTESKKNISPKVEQINDLQKLKFPLGKNTFSIPSSAAFNPNLDEKLLLSFKVNFKELPPAGLRQNIITKYNSKTFPYAGWGFGVSNLGTSVRPEFYWRANDNSGGWFTFADLEILPGNWYGFSILVSQDEYASIYFEKLGAKGERLNQSTSKFLGGANLLGIGLPINDGPLKIGPVRGRGDGEDFKGELSSVLIGKIKKVPENLEQFQKFLSGGPNSIKDRIQESEIKLWLRG